MTPIWAWFGYDEPNYTYAPGGRQLLSELAALSPVPVYVRTHNLLTSGDGTASLKWGSTNAYREDACGRPIYDWTIVDRIFATYVERGMKPLVKIGFMPEALSSTRPVPAPGNLAAADIFTGGPIRPRTTKWAELVYRMGSPLRAEVRPAEVESWWWEVWNEPESGTGKGRRKSPEAVRLRGGRPKARAADGPHRRPRRHRPQRSRPQHFLKGFSSMRCMAKLRDRKARVTARPCPLSRQRRASGRTGRLRTHERAQPASGDRQLCSRLWARSPAFPRAGCRHR